MITLEVGGVSLNLETSAPSLRTHLLRRYTGYLSDTEARRHLQLQLEDRSFDPRRALRFEMACDMEHLSFDSDACRARFDLQLGRGELTVVDSVPETQDCIDNFLRFLLSALAVDEDKVVLHASGVCNPDTGAGYLFAGDSGAGKSTIAILSHRSGYEVLNDDLVVCGLTRQAPMVYGTPFCGDVRYKLHTGELLPSNNRRCDLAGWFLLRQAAEHRIEDLPPAEQAAGMMASVLGIGWFPRERAERALATLSRMAARQPVQQLCFSEDAQFWTLIEG